jgi:release factor glutamine methyltransferase
LLLAALAEWPGARGLGIDASEDALAYACRNARALGMDDRAAFRAGDWAQGITETFDLVLCNPPYIATTEQLPADVADHEPPSALFAGPDGLDDYRILAPQIARLIAPGGMAAVEIGHTQAAAVSALLAGQGLTVRIARDLGGRDRAVIAQQS